MRKRSSSDMGLWLQQTMIRYGGYSSGDVANIGSHSLKATVLSWLAKAGVNHGVRRLLGGHAKVNDLTMLEYSRDALAGPLHTVSRVMKLIDQGTFDPDATRSGRWRDEQVVDVNMAVSAQSAPLEVPTFVAGQRAQERADSEQLGSGSVLAELCKECAKEGATGFCDFCFAPLHDCDDVVNEMQVGACGRICLCALVCCSQCFTHPGAAPHWCTKVLGWQDCALCDGGGGHECDVMGDQKPKIPDLPTVDSDSDSSVSSASNETHESEVSDEQVLEVDVIREGVAEQFWPDSPPMFSLPMGALVKQKHFGTIHLIRDGPVLDAQVVDWDKFKLYCGHRKSLETHTLIWGSAWPHIVTPRCDTCFSLHERWLQRAM